LIRAAISGAVIRGASNNKARIVFSYGSTTDPFDGRSYLGGASEANAARTVFLATPSRRAISLIATPSDRCKRRISAQFSTVITPTASGRGSRFPAPQGVSFQEASAQSRTLGPITKTGNGHARRLLVEAAWHHQHRYVPGKTIRDRWDLVSPTARARGDLGNRRLNHRWNEFKRRKKPNNVANAAIARELAGWCWSLAVLEA